MMDYLQRIDEEVTALRKDLEAVRQKSLDRNMYVTLENRMKAAEEQIVHMKRLLQKNTVKT